MNPARGVIQGSFPNGVSHLRCIQPYAHPHAQSRPAWVQERIAAPAASNVGAPKQPPIQRLPSGPMPLPAHLSRFPEGSGTPLPGEVRQKMEAVFRASFADVRIHVGPHVSAIGANAFTHGTHIHFAPGNYDPATPRGLQMLGHELTHVVQQRSGRVRNPSPNGISVVQDSMLEAEADRMARAAALTWQPKARAFSGPAVAQRARMIPIWDVTGANLDDLPPPLVDIDEAEVIVARPLARYRAKNAIASVAVRAGGGNSLRLRGPYRVNLPGADFMVNFLFGTQELDAQVTFKPVKIPKAAVDSDFFNRYTVNAYEIVSLDAKFTTGLASSEARGTGAGDLLLYHLAKKAVQDGVSWIVAGNVTGSRDKFYTPIGFCDFRNQKSWKDLQSEKKKTELALNEAKSSDLLKHATSYQAINDALAANKVFISAVVLYNATMSRWMTRWDPL